MRQISDIAMLGFQAACYYSSLPIAILTRKSGHFDEIFATGCAENGQIDDNFVQMSTSCADIDEHFLKMTTF